MNYTDLTTHELAAQLILVRAEKDAITAKEDEMKKEILNRDFDKETVEGITVTRKVRHSVKLLPTADIEKIKSLYPDLVEVTHVLDKSKINDEVMDYIKEKSPEAIKEVTDVNAKLLHEVTKEYTEQSLTPYIEIK